MNIYRVQTHLDDVKNGTCSECGSKSFRYQQGKVTCLNCGLFIGNIPKFGSSCKGNKYGARKTEFNGKRYDSKLEATVAQSLELRKQAGDIKDYDTQFKIEVWCYNSAGDPQFKVNHKVDFRVHNLDGSYELVEAKGVETTDYRWRRKFVEVFLSEHPEYTYKVIKQKY